MWGWIILKLTFWDFDVNCRLLNLALRIRRNFRIFGVTFSLQDSVLFRHSCKFELAWFNVPNSGTCRFCYSENLLTVFRFGHGDKKLIWVSEQRDLIGLAATLGQLWYGSWATLIQLLGNSLADVWHNFGYCLMQWSEFELTTDWAGIDLDWIWNWSGWLLCDNVMF